MRHGTAGLASFLVGTWCVATTLSGCSVERPEAPAELQADTLYTNATLWTGVPDAQGATAMAVRDGMIVYVGDGTDLQIDVGETVDLGGRFVMPGFIDAHVHFLYGGAGLASVNLRDAATPEEFTRRIAAHAATLPPRRWVLNGDWDHTLWGGELPRKDWIDEVTGDTPVFVMRLDGHMALANSAALALAGVTAATVAPPGGEIVRSQDGEPTGLVKDNAMNLVMAAIPPPSDDELLRAFELAQEHALGFGVVAVHDMRAGSIEDDGVDAYRLARGRGLMKLRVQTFPHIEHWQRAVRRIEEIGRGDAQLGWPGVKGFVDGSLGSGTAWFHEPYSDQPGERGFPLVDMDDLRQQAADADAAGLRLVIHAIGDRAIDELIDIMASTAGDSIAKRRYRIEHFQHPTAAAIDALAEHGIIASMQPYHAIDDGRWAQGRIGPARAKTTYAFRRVLDAGGHLSFGSDWPVAPLSPLEGIYAAVTRRTIDGANPDGWQPQEKITVEEALRAYTSANAYAGFEEDLTGTLGVGKKADFVVLSDDPRAVEPEAIRAIEVLRTVIDGETVMEKH